MKRLRTLSKGVAELSPAPITLFLTHHTTARATSGFQVLLPCTSQELCNHHHVHTATFQQSSPAPNSILELCRAPHPSPAILLSPGVCAHSCCLGSRRGEGQQLQLRVPTCRGTLQLLCCTHTASTPWERTKTSSWDPG